MDCFRICAICSMFTGWSSIAFDDPPTHGGLPSSIIFMLGILVLYLLVELLAWFYRLGQNSK